MKKWILSSIFILVVTQIIFSQVKAEIVLQMSPQLSTLDMLYGFYGFSSSFSPGILYSSELGFFLSKRLKVNIGLGYSEQENRLKYSKKTSTIKNTVRLKSSYKANLIIAEYTYFIKNKATLFCGIGFQRKKKLLEGLPITSGGILGISFLNKKTYHSLIRSGVKYSNQNIFIKIAGQIDIPILKKDASNALLIGLNIGLGVNIDKAASYLFLKTRNILHI